MPTCNFLSLLLLESMVDTWFATCYTVYGRFMVKSIAHLLSNNLWLVNLGVDF